MMRKLAVPIALRNAVSIDRNTMTAKTRILKPSQGDPDGYHILEELAENRARIEKLHMELDHAVQDVDCTDIVNELEYLKMDIELSLVEVSAEIEDSPSAEEILSQEAEAVLA